MTSTVTGKLYIVATPIGNLADMSMRAIDTLKLVDVIAAEDTRHSGRLLQHFSIQATLYSLHKYNEKQRSEQLLSLLEEGQEIALISDAGTPLISDPGYTLVTTVKQAGIPVIPIPGSCALIAALSSSGLPTEKFIFEGFLPAKASQRNKVLAALINETRTVLFYESPKRVIASLTAIQAELGQERRVCVAREMTKLYETIITDTVGKILQRLKAQQSMLKGECVIIIAGNIQPMVVQDQQRHDILSLLLAELPVKKAATLTAKITGCSKNTAYEEAIEIQQRDRKTL